MLFHRQRQLLALLDALGGDLASLDFQKLLFLHCRERAASNEEALEKVRQKYEDAFFKTDLHLFLGTTFEWHSRAPNPWVIIGVFPPPRERQLRLL